MFQNFSKATLSYWKKGDTRVLRQSFSLNETDCYTYWWMVVSFEWTLSNFFKLFAICSFRSLLKTLNQVQDIWSIIIEHSLFKKFDWGRGNSYYSATSLENRGAYVEQSWHYVIFSTNYDLIYKPCDS